MSTTIKNVILAGASGNLGPHVLNALHAAHFTISALTRSTNTKLPPYVTAIATDYSLDSLVSAFSGQDAVVSCLGVAGVSLQLTMIDAAETAGAQRFIPSEWGWAQDIPMLEELKQRLAEKKQVCEHLVDVCAKSETLSWTAVAAGPFLDWALTQAPALGFMVGPRTARIIDGGNEPVTASTGAAIGKAAAGILTHADGTANRFVKIHSVVFTQQTLLAALEKATGSHWTVEAVTTADIVEHKKSLLAQKNFFGAFLDVLGQQLFEAGAGRGRHVRADESDNVLLGVSEQGVDVAIEGLLGSS